MKRDLYAEITDSIVRELESGTIPWLKPWRDNVTGGNVSAAMPANAVTGRAYSGVNVILLWSRAQECGFKSGRWLTYKQAAECGGHVRKGETGTHIVFVKIVRKGEGKRKGDGENDKGFSFLKSYCVFNVEQCDGLPDHVLNGKPLPPAPVLAENFRKFVAATKADIRHGGDRAYYSTSGDYVQLPIVESFRSAANYKATTLHELAHWSGHKERLNRDLNNRFGGEAYAAEELIAELSAAFLCADLGVQGELRHAAYVESWLRVLKNDKRAIFTAASKASQAASYLKEFSGDAIAADDSEEMAIAA